MIDWGTVFVVGLYGLVLFGSAALADAVQFLVSRARRTHGTQKETIPAPPDPAPQGQRPVPQAQGRAAPPLTERRVARVRLVRRHPVP